MSRRSLTLFIASVGTAAAIAVSVLIPVPYVILGPGPTLNTLGSLSGTPLIKISGHPTYPASGHLNMVTVSYAGGPGVAPEHLPRAGGLAESGRGGRARNRRSSRPASPPSRASSRTPRR